MEDECGYLKPRMWTQYAHNAQGVCLALSRSQLVSEAKAKFEPGNYCYLDDVKYLSFEDFRADPIHIQMNAIGELGINGFLEMFFEVFHGYLFRKHLDFKDENEFRIAVIPKEQDIVDPFLSVGKCLRGLIVNSETAKPYRKILSDYKNEYGLELVELEWMNQGVFPHVVP